MTILFSDVVGSTALGDTLDAETLRGVMSRYFTSMEAEITAHGGRVEKFVGDAIMAVFGLPRLHEDDALRAARAAIAMRRALAQLNDRLESEVGVRIAVRTGVNTGEVVAGQPDGQTLVTGDAVNTAARLEQAASAGEILVGSNTAVLVGPAATLERVAPIVAKGKPEAVEAFRLVTVAPVGSATRVGHQGAFVARQAEVGRLAAAFEDVVRAGAAGIVTVVGIAGVGKSRLVAEFGGNLEDDGKARVLRGRCLSYGEGLTYWPLREVVLAAAGVTGAEAREDVQQRIEALCGPTRDGPLIADRLSTAIGAREGSVAADEVAWASRRTLERLAEERPLALIIEDIHWARTPMLELLRHLRDEAARPILIVCPSRPDLLDSAPDFVAPAVRNWTITLDGLPSEAGEQLIAGMPGSARLSQRLRERILEIAEGNPLFIEEMVRLVGESGNPSVAIPPTIEALLAARIDQLPREELAVAQRGAVIGRVFERPPVEALLPADRRAGLDSSLRALLRKDFVQSERTSRDATVDAYKFRHILIRDAAYNAMAKLERALLHEAFADWLSGAAAGRIGEFDEILGHHLEQAYRYREELRQLGETAALSARRASRHLASAARTAIGRGDAAASAALYERALELPGWTQTERALLLVDVSESLLTTGSVQTAIDRAEAAFELAIQLGDRRLLARSRIARLRGRLDAGLIGNPSAEANEEVDLALADAEASTDPLAIAAAMYERSNQSYYAGLLDESAAQLELALESALSGGDELLAMQIDSERLPVAVVGSTPAGRLVELAQVVITRMARNPAERGNALRLLAFAESMLGRTTEARLHLGESRAIADDLRRPHDQIQVRFDGGWVEDMAGDVAAAEQQLREAMARSDAIGDPTAKSFAASRLAIILANNGRLADAVTLVPDPDDVPTLTNRARFLAVRARLRAAAGDQRARDDVSSLLEMAANLAFVIVKTDVLAQVGEVMTALGERDAARGYMTQALELAERKESLVIAGRLRERLRSL